jgi:ligand-binding sensor domain-containing protein
VPRRGLPALTVEAMAIGPGNVAYAARGNRLFRSSDGGDTWLESGSRPIGGRILAMAVDRVSGALYVATAGDGLWLTADQGASWSASLPGRSVYAVAESAGGRVYAGTEDGLYISLDHGASWRMLPAPELQGPVTVLAVGPASPDRLFVSLAGGPVQYSADGGATWQSLRRRPGGGLVTALAVDPAAPGYLYAGTSEGLWRCRLPQGAERGSED